MSDINYKCTVVRLPKLTKHPNADKLQIADIFGNTVIVGNDVKEGDLGLFFPLEAKIGEKFLKVNNLYRDKTLNVDQNKQGFFEKNGRVRAMKLRGIPSMGYWCEVEYLSFLFPTQSVAMPPDEGDSFNELNGVSISTKYVPKTSLPRENRINLRAKKHDRFIKDQFKEHFDTEHLFKNLDEFKPFDKIVITWKLHGTSARAGNVLVKRQFPWLLGWLVKLLQIIGVPVQDSEYAYLYGSRKVIKDVNNKNQAHWYEKDLWTEVGKSHFEDKLHKGEMVYYEIVGYVPGTSTLIQKGFPYGCKEGQCEVYIYRITNTNPDGKTFDLSWEAVKHRSEELGVKYVPEAVTELDYTDWAFRELDTTLYMRMKGENNHLQDGIKRYFLETDCHLDPSHPEEGICVRKEGLNPEIYKVKSFRFLEHETEMLDKEEVDIETEQSNK